MTKDLSLVGMRSLTSAGKARSGHNPMWLCNFEVNRPTRSLTATCAQASSRLIPSAFSISHRDELSAQLRYVEALSPISWTRRAHLFLPDVSLPLIFGSSVELQALRRSRPRYTDGRHSITHDTINVRPPSLKLPSSSSHCLSIQLLSSEVEGLSQNYTTKRSMGSESAGSIGLGRMDSGFNGEGSRGGESRMTKGKRVVVGKYTRHACAQCKKACVVLFLVTFFIYFTYHFPRCVFRLFLGAFVLILFVFSCLSSIIAFLCVIPACFIALISFPGILVLFLVFLLIVSR
ncbi:hypothetical protein DFH11DRAFT_1623469 [Phellopilus nigrolimitatus]|nr:hypothetical protein DFH11DRAFT_1623469 [Phellopilus nigrolimitatus]